MSRYITAISVAQLPLGEEASDGRASDSNGQQQSPAGPVAHAQLERPELGGNAGVETLGQLETKSGVDDRQCRSPSALQSCDAAGDDREEEVSMSFEPANSTGLVATEDILPDTRLLEHGERGEAEGNAHSSANESDQVQ